MKNCSYLLILLLLINSKELKATNRDSLQLVMQGLQNGETYIVLYNNIVVRKIKCSHKRCSEYIGIKLDTTYLEGNFLNIQVLRKGRFGLFYRDTYLSPTFKNEYKYLIIFRNNHLKNRYALDYFWSNDKLKYYD
jgi:hypothetical protein